jgi:hypothetical protein
VTLVALIGIAAVTDLVPYVRDILRGLMQPHRGTWLIRSTLGVVVLGSRAADGATWSLALVGASRADLSLIGLATLGVGGWAISSRPVVATDASLLLYPSHNALGNGAIAALILRRRRSIRPEPVEIPLAG